MEVIMKRKILIVEDELEIAELEKDYLELSDFEVTIETDGEKGRDMALTGEYDMLILDIMLPGEDGYKICQLYREKYLMPVIIVSAKGEDSDKVHGLGLGADDYMVKPFNLSELVARVKAHMKRYETLTGIKPGRTLENEVILTGDLEIDTKSRRVFVRGEEQLFTMKEFDLLCFFARNPDTVLTKSVIYEKVWGYPLGNASEKSDKATVTVHVKKIRNKIEEDPSGKPQYIETVWGTGYRFNTLNKTNTEEWE